MSVILGETFTPTRAGPPPAAHPGGQSELFAPPEAAAYCGWYRAVPCGRWREAGAGGETLNEAWERTLLAVRRLNLDAVDVQVLRTGRKP